MKKIRPMPLLTLVSRIVENSRIQQQTGKRHTKQTDETLYFPVHLELCLLYPFSMSE